MTKDTTILHDHLLSTFAQGNFGFVLPAKSSRLTVMMRIAQGNICKEDDEIELEYVKAFVKALRGRCADLCITHFAEKVGAVIAFTDSNNSMHWRFCSLEKDGNDAKFGIMVGEYIHAVNQLLEKKPKVSRLLPVFQGLQGSFGEVARRLGRFIKPIGIISVSGRDDTDSTRVSLGAVAVLEAALIKTAVTKLFNNSRLISSFLASRQKLVTCMIVEKSLSISSSSSSSDIISGGSSSSSSSSNSSSSTQELSHQYTECAENNNHVRKRKEKNETNEVVMANKVQRSNITYNFRNNRTPRLIYEGEG